ncbi:hypothetical protein [Proteus columbae]|uniref:hypothetical protein n=1 Tax=Proteus columbae TaxID=1987580 RepID=UPI002889BED7|nr:hypothetical protein [Proteus columbae]
MVTKLSIPKYNSIEIINAVLTERKKFLAFYELISNDLRDQINLYIKEKGDPTNIIALNLKNYTKSNEEAEKRKTTLINLFSPKKEQPLYTILEEMRINHGLLFCPSCGEDGAPGTLDHYLPKTEFPELSICIANLTPMCSTCQNKKSSEYLTPYGKKAFFHPYFDEIMFSLFHVNILPPYSKPSDFNLIIKESIPSNIKVLVESHIKGIQLKKRFEKYCESKYLHLLKLVADERKEEEPLKAHRLIRIFLRQEEQKSLNAWGAIFYQSVLNTPTLLNYLDNGTLPKFI